MAMRLTARIVLYAVLAFASIVLGSSLAVHHLAMPELPLVTLAPAGVVGLVAGELFHQYHRRKEP
jgi:hypothetical protein